MRGIFLWHQLRKIEINMAVKAVLIRTFSTPPAVV